jgi:hypothetical protein
MDGPSAPMWRSVSSALCHSVPRRAGPEQAQLAPITPVPTMAMRLMGLLVDMLEVPSGRIYRYRLHSLSSERIVSIPRMGDEAGGAPRLTLTMALMAETRSKRSGFGKSL